MIRNVSVGSEYNNFGQQSKDIENIIKYSMGTSVVAQEDNPFSGMGIMIGLGAVTEAYKGGKWLWSNRKDLKGAWANFSQEANAKTAAFNNAGGYKNVNAYKMALNEQKAKTIDEFIPSEDKFERLSKETQAQYTKVKEMAKFATENPQQATRAFKLANARLAKANLMAHEEYIKAPSKVFKNNKYTDVKLFDNMIDGMRTFFARTGKVFKKYTGISTLNGELKTLATKSPVTARLLKYGKGNGLFLAITGVTELLTQVIPAFKLGPDKGVTQIVKSGVNTAASIGGWVAGSAIGAQGGAMLGAAIGAVGGPVGSIAGGIVGSIVGLIGGCVGSWVALKASKAFIGESEVEKAKEKQAREMAKEVGKNPEAVKELMVTAAQKLNSEGIESEDAKVAFTSIQNLAQSVQDNDDTNNKTFNKKA